MLTRHKEHSSQSFFKKVFLSFLFVSITLTILLTTFLTINYFKTSANLVTRLNHNMLSQLNYSINYLNEQSNRLSISLSNDKDVIAFLNMKQKNNLIPVLVNNALNKHIVTLGNVESIYLYNSELDLFFSSKSGEQLSSDQFSDREIARLVTTPDFITSYNGKPMIHQVPLPNSSSTETCTYIVFDSYSNKSDIKNAVIINMRLSILTDSIKTMNQFKSDSNMSYFVADKDGTLIDTPLSQPFIDKQKVFSSLQAKIATQNNENKNHFINLDHNRYLMSYTNDNPNGWYIIGLIPTNIIFKDIISSSVLSVIFVICIFILCFMACILLARDLNNPIIMITKLMTGQSIDKSYIPNFKTNELKTIWSTFHTMQEQNKRLDKLKKETSYSVKQDLLNSLISVHSIYSLEVVASKLEQLNLSYLAGSGLCMVLLKIDNYNAFLLNTNQQECWALKFTVVNIAEEISSEHYTCDVFSSDSDKFVLLIKCDETADYKEFQNQLEPVLRSIQENVKKYISLSLSIAYSTPFKGLEHLPMMYSNMKNSILLKLRYGHQSIISPYMADEIDTDNLMIPVNQFDALIGKLLEGKLDASKQAYEKISTQLSTYNYDEVMTNLIHLIYNIYTSVVVKYPTLKEYATLMVKHFMVELQNIEVVVDVDKLMNDTIESLCQKVTNTKNNSEYQSKDYIIKSICDIIEKEYSNYEICLIYIADKLGLSPNYIGHIFKSVKGKSIAQYIQDLRIEKLAYYLNHSSLSLEEILDKVGLEKNNYFYTLFKKHFGVSLSEYRLNLVNKGL
ncbi:AraC family transcriptional regulator [Lachnoclostridium sp.]|uniref:AraC family transcriptional regulator n=1 Tax=Lachnoclostridium sp. TaxID=2028282 RepID=UPI00289B751E|nr:AraC family transcriptional regulator [Lachnoclostridium sp.]